MGPVFLCFYTESGAEEPLTAFSLHVLFQEVLPVFRAVAAFGGVYDVVRLDQNLIIDAVNIRVGMVVAHQISHPVHLLRRQTRIRQKAPYQGAALFLLSLAVSIAVFFPAQGAGDVIGDCGDLQCFLGPPVQPLQLADGFGVGPLLRQGYTVQCEALGGEELPLLLSCIKSSN